MKGNHSATFLWIVLFLIPVGASSSLPSHGNVLDLHTGQHLYHFVREESVTGDQKVIRVRFKSGIGKIAVFEQLEYKNKIPIRYEIQQYQTGEYGWVHMTPEHLEYVYTKAGVTRHRIESRSPSQMVIDQIPDFLAENTARLCEGKDLKFQFIVAERLRSYSFLLQLDPQFNCDLYDEVEVRMKPSNYIMALLVKPIVMKWNHKRGRLLEVSGRLPLYKISGGRMVPLRAVLQFEYDKKR